VVGDFPHTAISLACTKRDLPRYAKDQCFCNKVARHRRPVFDPGAKKRTVSLTLNADLYVKAKAEGINASQVAEEALAQALKARLLEKARAEIEKDMAALNAYIEEHGSPAEMLREYLAKRDGAG
jgi:post-segregation antitoxin (ccd killing protein)